MTHWVDACAVDDIEEEDVIRFDHAGQSYAIYRLRSGAFCATSGFCTHENVHLADGLVIGQTIECPKHNGRFDIPSGQAKRAPACIDLRSFPVRIEGDRVLLGLG
ncbi:MocE family 2Fe-2S type ferredoxin [Acidisoma sp. C75]